MNRSRSSGRLRPDTHEVLRNGRTERLVVERSGGEGQGDGLDRASISRVLTPALASASASVRANHRARAGEHERRVRTGHEHRASARRGEWAIVGSRRTRHHRRCRGGDRGFAPEARGTHPARPPSRANPCASGSPAGDEGEGWARPCRSNQNARGASGAARTAGMFAEGVAGTRGGLGVEGTIDRALRSMSDGWTYHRSTEEYEGTSRGRRYPSRALPRPVRRSQRGPRSPCSRLHFGRTKATTCARQERYVLSVPLLAAETALARPTLPRCRLARGPPRGCQRLTIAASFSHASATCPSQTLCRSAAPLTRSALVPIPSTRSLPSMAQPTIFPLSQFR